MLFWLRIKLRYQVHKLIKTQIVPIPMTVATMISLVLFPLSLTIGVDHLHINLHSLVLLHHHTQQRIDSIHQLSCIY